MEQRHAQDSDLAGIFKSLIETSVAAALQRFHNESSATVHAQIERAVTSALERRFGILSSQLDTDVNPNASSFAAARTFAQASITSMPTVSGSPLIRQSQNLLGRSESELVPSAALKAPVFKPESGQIIDHANGIAESPETAPDSMASLSRPNVDPADSVVVGRQGKATPSVRGRDRAVRNSRFKSLRRQERRSMEFLQKRLLEESEDTDSATETASNDNYQRTLSGLNEKVSKDADSNHYGDSDDSSESDWEPPSTKRAKKTWMLAGYTDGPPIRFLKLCGKLTARASRRGWPRIVDLEDFSQQSNKENLTMADIVATILWNHGRETLEAFLDFEDTPGFCFKRQVFDPVNGVFAISRSDRMITCEQDVFRNPRPWVLRGNGVFKYRIEADGEWVPYYCSWPLSSTTSSVHKIQGYATELGTELFCDEVWKEDGDAEITVKVLEQ